MSFENQANHGVRVTHEVEVDETCVLFCGYTTGPEDEMPDWIHAEIQSALDGIKRKLADGWDGTESDTDEDEAGVGAVADGPA